MFHRFGHSADVGEAFDAAWVCTLGPDAVVDWSPVVAAAKRASKEDSISVPCMVGRGAVLYRSGCFSQAVQLLTQADQLLRDHPSPSSPVYAWLYLAMAEHNLGHREERGGGSTKPCSGWRRKANGGRYMPSRATLGIAASP